MVVLLAGPDFCSCGASGLSAAELISQAGTYIGVQVPEHSLDWGEHWQLKSRPVHCLKIVISATEPSSEQVDYGTVSRQVETGHVDGVAGDRVLAVHLLLSVSSKLWASLALVANE